MNVGSVAVEVLDGGLKGWKFMDNRKKWLNPTETQDGSKYGKKLPEYAQWNSMKERCRVGGGCQEKIPSYIGCTYVSEWASYDVWVEWARQQVGFLNTDDKGKIWQQDKDILFKGNKVYSPDTCVFVPKEVNTFHTLRSRFRGEYPCGVSFKENNFKYSAKIVRGGCGKHLGIFDTPEAAFLAYKAAKEAYAKQLAVKYTGLVDSRVVDALNNFTVNIED